jgi:hypothetical protein
VDALGKLNDRHAVHAFERAQHLQDRCAYTLDGWKPDASMFALAPHSRGTCALTSGSMLKWQSSAESQLQKITSNTAHSAEQVYAIICCAVLVCDLSRNGDYEAQTGPCVW